MSHQPEFLIDGVHPYDNPNRKKSSVSLEETVKEEMRAQGLDPLNKDDVQKFWASKGIGING